MELSHMNKLLVILLVTFLVGCDADLGTRNSDSGNTDNSIVNEASECPLCSNEEGLESLGYDVEFIDCFDECPFCEEGDEDCDDEEQAGCRDECRDMNEESLEAVIETCRDTYLCTDISNDSD